MSYIALKKDDHCGCEAYTASEVLSILQQAIDAGSLQGIDPDASPIVALIRESRADANISLWVGTEAQFNAITPAVTASLVMGRIDSDGKVYLCTDDSTLADWQTQTIALSEAAALEVCTTELADKADKVSGATNGNFAGVDANGNLTDSGNNAADFENAGAVSTHNSAADAHSSLFAAKQAQHTTATATLTVAGWTDNAQTVSATGVTATNTVIIAPASASQTAYGAAGIVCTAQGAGTLAFTCTAVPTDALTVNVVILGV